MIRLFSIQNFKSILETRVDFSYAEGKAPPASTTSETLPFLEDGKSKTDRVVPVLAIYGANASGKSNLIQAFQVFQTLLRHGIAGIYQPNKLNRQFAATQFAVDVMVQDGTFCSYAIAYNEGAIVHEELVRHATGSKEKDDKVVFRLCSGDGVLAKTMIPTADFSGLVTDDYPAERLDAAIRVECSDAEGHQIRPFLWCLVRSFAGLSQTSVLLWRELMERLYVSSRNEFLLSQGIDFLAGDDTDSSRQKAMDEIAVLLRKFDFGIQNMSMIRQKLPSQAGDGCHVPEGSIICRRERDVVVDQITSRHVDVDGRLVPFNFMTDESEGTKVIAGLLGICLWAMKTGRTVVVDELDRSLHPLILIELVKLFKLKKYNRKGAQLIFTAHDPTLMEDSLMRLGEIGIVNNGLHSGTTLKRLTDLKKEGMDIRNVHNFRKMYMDGFFAGIPYPTM